MPISHTSRPPWHWNEFAQVGKDYARPDEAAVYDATHAEFRDVASECAAVLDSLELAPGETLVEFGTGTGELALAAARRGLRVQAVDVSPAMLEIARAKANEADAESERIAFHHAGFLSYEHAGPPADAIASSLALHHLPDFWKGVALRRLRRMLKPGGRFHLNDVVLADSDAGLERISAFVEAQAALGGDFLREDAEQHFREEFSTCDWILEGLLERAGFAVEHCESDGLFATYLCRAR